MLNDQKALIIGDAFRAQLTEIIAQELERLNVVQVMVPKNMRYLLQQLDLTTNASMKKLQKKSFSDNFTINVIIKEMLNDPTRDVTTIEVDLRLSILKPDHA